ncbi:hypothetical protein [Amycolatopsis sp. NPDC051716]|uniref:hypothetical protein n=1 Tax=Amycolatopsis sp. NPDC051716 TaxID=3155804 RepID=UPI0034453023
MKQTYQAGPRISNAIWYRGDRYSLDRLDGSHVVGWETLIGDGKDFRVEDRYPQETRATNRKG